MINIGKKNYKLGYRNILECCFYIRNDQFKNMIKDILNRSENLRDSKFFKLSGKDCWKNNVKNLFGLYGFGVEFNEVGVYDIYNLDRWIGNWDSVEGLKDFDDEMTLFTLLAPYVNERSYISFCVNGNCFKLIFCGTYGIDVAYPKIEWNV